MQAGAKFVKLSGIAVIIALLVLAGLGGGVQASRLAGTATMNASGTAASTDNAYPPCPSAVDIVPTKRASLAATIKSTLSATMKATVKATVTPTVSSTVVATMEAGNDFDVMTGCELYGTFSGKAEVPVPGSDQAGGTVELKLSRGDVGTGMVCYQLHITSIKPARAAHIQKAATGISGAVVVPFPIAPDEKGDAIGCASGVDRDTIKDMLLHPWLYYVNVRTADFPGGAARAQLSATKK